MTLVEDRRQPNHWVKDLVIPLILAVIVGVSAAIVTVRVSVAVIESQMAGMGEDVLDLKLMLGVVRDNQLAKTKLEIITSDNSDEIDRIWTEINRIKNDRYTQEDAERDIAMLRMEAKVRHEYESNYDIDNGIN